MIVAVAIAALGLLLVSTPAVATPIVLDADDYVEGANISSRSPYATLATTSGAPVYSSVIHEEYHDVDGNDGIGLLGRRVFSSNPHYNSEWYYWPEDYPESNHGLDITFSQPVRSFSLLMGEIYLDAGPGSFPDPYHIDIFDVGGEIIERRCAPHGCMSELLILGGVNPDGLPSYAHWKVSYEGGPISRVILGGESEPTTIDRLEFSVSHKVSEPGALALFVFGLGGIILVKIRSQRLSLLI